MIEMNELLPLVFFPVFWIRPNEFRPFLFDNDYFRIRTDQIRGYLFQQQKKRRRRKELQLFFMKLNINITEICGMAVAKVCMEFSQIINSSIVHL